MLHRIVLKSRMNWGQSQHSPLNASTDLVQPIRHAVLPSSTEQTSLRLAIELMASPVSRERLHTN